MTPLRQHMAALHPQAKRARSNTDLARQHARIHHRLHCNHTHEEDNAGALAGPGSDRRRPSGWQTGGGVLYAQARLAEDTDTTAWVVALALVARLGAGAEAYAATTPALAGGARR